MPRFGIISAVTAAVATAAVVASTALAGGTASSATTAFTASYTGKAIVKISGPRADIAPSVTARLRRERPAGRELAVTEGA